MAKRKNDRPTNNRKPAHYAAKKERRQRCPKCKGQRVGFDSDLLMYYCFDCSVHFS